MNQAADTTGEVIEEKAINLYKKIIHSLEQILLKINNSISEDLASLGQLIPGSITLLRDFIQCDWIICKDGGQNAIDYAGMIELLYQIITWLFAYGSGFHFLHQLLSLLVSWTDKSQDFRHLLVSSGFLLHHCLYLTLLQQYERTPIMIIQLSIAILANCALDIDHRVYLNQIEWKGVLGHWLSYGHRGIQMHTKFLCGLLTPAFDHSRYELFGMIQAEVDTVVELLGTASSSPTMMAAGWDMQFSALELVENMIYLCFYPPNLTSFAKAELMPTVISLLMQQNLSLSKAVIQLVWILLEDGDFQSQSKPFMDDVMDVCSDFSVGNDELQFLMNLLHFTPTSQDDKNSSGFSVLYCLPIKDWYFLSNTFLEVDLDKFVPLSKVGSEANKQIIFAIWIRAIGLCSTNREMLWNILREKCNSYQELEQKFELMSALKKDGNMNEAASTDVVVVVRSDERQVAKDHIPAKPAFQKPVIKDKEYDHADIAVMRKQMSKGMNLLYSLCLKYKVDFKLSNVSVRLSRWSSLWHYVSLSNEFISNEMVENIIEDLIEANLTLDAVYELLSTLNRAVKVRETTKEPTILLQRITGLLCTWVLASQRIVHYLTSSGLLLNHCEYLLKWSQESSTKLVDFLVLKNLHILLKCCWEKDFQYYGNAFLWLTLLPKLYASNDDLIQVAVKFISANLSFTLSDSGEHLWKLQEKEVVLLLEIFKQTYFKETSDKKLQLKITDILLGLQRLIEAHNDNLNTIMVEVWMLLNWAVEVLAKGSVIERKNMAILVCMLLRSPTAKETLLTSNDCFFLHNIHKAAHVVANSSLRGLLNCIVCASKDQAQLDCDDYKTCCENSYAYGLYLECVNWYQKLKSASGSDDPKELMKFKVYNAKALFHIYKREQMKIKANELRIGKEFTILKKQCYSKTKEVINVLSRAFDDGYLECDSEGLYMLDISMMDYIHATNKLNDLKRCYLCQKRLYIPQEIAEGVPKDEVNPRETKATDDGNAQTTCSGTKSTSDRPTTVKKHNKSNLIHSHLIPKSILDRFTQALPSPKHLKIFAVSHTGTLLEVDKGKVYSPKPLGRDMCCFNCEDILNSKGENPFMKKFFDKIYNPSNPTSPKQELFIEYGPWLYHFCAGLIFRNILLPPFTFLNEKEVYNLLFLLRKCVLNLDAMKDGECPEIYVLTTPLSVEGDELKYGRLNYVLTGSLEWYFGRYNLTSGEHDVDSPLKAHFFLMHIGMFNVLVKLSPSASCQIPEGFHVNVKGGLYHVLPEENRQGFIPMGMWKLFYDEAKDYEKELFEKGESTSAVKITPEMYQTDKMRMFEIIGGAFKELSFSMQEIQPSPSATSPKIFNLLPEGFHITRYSDSKENYVFTLPQGHLPIVHQRFTIEDGTEETIFICIGQNGSFKLTQPYVIWHNFRPGLEFSICFFMDPCDLSLIEAVGDSKALQTSAAKTSLLATKEKIAPVVPKLLLDRGILKLESLIKRISLIREFPNVDQACCTTGCWYCSGRCDNCFKVIESSGQNEGKVKHCSEACQSILCEVPSDLHIIICKPDETAPDSFQRRCSPLDKSHQEFFHVYASGASSDGLPYQSEYAVCSGRQSSGSKFSSNLYVVHFSHKMQHQLMIEFFINEELHPLSALPHAEGDVTTITVINALKDAGAVQETLSAAFENLTFEEKMLIAEEMSQLKSTAN